MLTYTDEITAFTDADGLPAVRVEKLSDFLISQIFDCGQCFRFEPTADGSFEGVAHGRYIRFSQPDSSTLEIHNSTPADYENIWKRYLSLDADYNAVRADIASRFDIASHGKDTIMPTAMEYGSGIRILRQEPWETLCSFIVSQNNNIPRIKKIIAAMSERYGEPTECAGHTYYAFPTAESLVSAGVGGLAALRTGFRAKYIFDAAERVASGELDLEKVSEMTPDEAMEALCEIKGVGPKVASCAMLFGLGMTSAFPIDVWIKRVIAKYYPDGLDIPALGEYAGIAQQYLFYYERYNVGS